MSKIKLLFLVIIGNILEYYDFLLFAHIGYFIVPKFIPAHYAEQSYLFALMMFALPFVIRPIGGYFFGRIADYSSTNKALSSTLFYASIASMMIALLPSYDHIGLVATILFITLRSMQGFALGGEYTTAGTLLMDEFAKNKSFISGILGASGTIGSIIAFLFATLYSQFYKDTEVWRLFFMFGGVATYFSYYLRKHSLHPTTKMATSESNTAATVPLSSIYKTLALGAITSVSCFVPMVYSNFYFTNILGFSPDVGLTATIISLVTYVICTPLVGYLCDRININAYMPITFILALPLFIIGFYFIYNGSLIGQVPLTIAASIVGANIHVLMHQMFPLRKRSRSVNLYFAIGASAGGLVPALSGYMSMHYNFLEIPIIAIFFLLNGCMPFLSISKIDFCSEGTIAS